MFQTYLNMLLQVLGSLEALAAEVALVRLKGNMDTDMRSDVVTLNSGCPTLIPLAGEVKVVGALATNMLLANVFLKGRFVSIRGSSTHHHSQHIPGHD